jgi:hypothetical protein
MDTDLYTHSCFYPFNDPLTPKTAYQKNQIGAKNINNG